MDSSVFEEAVDEIVENILDDSVDSCLQLIRFSQKLGQFKDKVCLINVLLKALEGRWLLDCLEQKMHIYAHVKCIRKNIKGNNAPKEDVKLSLYVLKKLEKHEAKIFQLYQGYVEDQDKSRIQQLHKQNPELHSIVSNFVSPSLSFQLENIQQVFGVLYTAV